MTLIFFGRFKNVSVYDRIKQIARRRHRVSVLVFSLRSAALRQSPGVQRLRRKIDQFTGQRARHYPSFPTQDRQVVQGKQPHNVNRRRGEEGSEL